MTLPVPIRRQHRVINDEKVDPLPLGNILRSAFFRDMYDWYENLHEEDKRKLTLKGIKRKAVATCFKLSLIYEELPGNWLQRFLDSTKATLYEKSRLPKTYHHLRVTEQKLNTTKTAIMKRLKLGKMEKRHSFMYSNTKNKETSVLTNGDQSCENISKTTYIEEQYKKQIPKQNPAKNETVYDLLYETMPNLKSMNGYQSSNCSSGHSSKNMPMLVPEVSPENTCVRSAIKKKLLDLSKMNPPEWWMKKYREGQLYHRQLLISETENFIVCFYDYDCGEKGLDNEQARDEVVKSPYQGDGFNWHGLAVIDDDHELE